MLTAYAFALGGDDFCSSEAFDKNLASDDHLVATTAGPTIDYWPPRYVCQFTSRMSGAITTQTYGVWYLLAGGITVALTGLGAIAGFALWRHRRARRAG